MHQVVRHRHGINSIGVTLASKLAPRRLSASKMGNAPSVVEGPDKGRRTAQKLTKPRTTNVVTAGLLDPNPPPNPRRRFSAARTWSLPYGTEPAPSPLYPSSDAGTADQWDDNHDSERVGRSRSAKNIFRSRSSQGGSRNGEAKQDGHLATPAPSTRPSRANSMIVGTADHLYYGLGGRPGYGPHAIICFVSFTNAALLSWSTATPSMASNYGICPYENNRLLNLTEEPTCCYEEQSNRSEGAMRTVPSSPQLPAVAGNPASASISRAESEISLCTPMRRRSLQVPGVATRAAPQVPPLPKKSTARYSMPSTPSRRGSWDTLEMAMPSAYERGRGVAEVVRASTPCDDDYGHIGAFKLGTLRITNGSPATSPVVDSDSSEGEGDSQTKPETSKGQTYFDQIKSSADGSTERQASGSPVSPGSKAEYLPETTSNPPVAELQIASKSTAIDDDLFAVEQAEFSQLEVLDVRVDPSAKSIPPRPCLASEGNRSREINRSDSGIVASPTSEYSQKALSKADSGYSSNVSLRSFSRTATVRRKGHAAASEPCASPSASSPPDSTELSSREATPPPAPTQSEAPTTPARTSRELSPAARPNSWLRGRKSISKKAKNRLALDPTSQPQPSPTLSEFSLQSPTGFSKSGSGFSISSITRKNGKLQRLLGHGRGPANLPPTHPTEVTVVSPIPLEVEARFAKRTESYPSMMRRQSVKPEASKETLGTIFSVGSAEMVNEHGICLSPTVPVDAGALMVTPMPVAREPAAVSTSSIPPSSPTAYTRVGVRVPDVSPSVVTSGRPAGSVPTQRSRRSATLTTQSSPMDGGAHPLLGPSRPSSTLEPLSFSRKFKSPPPVSLRTRNMGSPQPPSRAQSTPPGTSRATSLNLPLSASTSWENMGQNAQEGYRGCPPARIPLPSPSLQPSVLSTVGSGRGAQLGQPQSLSARSSFVRSRGNSLSSQTSQRTGEMAHSKPTLQRHSAIVPPMRQRIGSDGSVFHPPTGAVVDQTPIRDNGPYPSVDGKVSDPWTGSFLGSGAQQPPHAPRSHSRNRSVGSADPHPAPYRVLHSYNSPAYRNVPIWG